eukprot:TRINITY_DN247_c5_g1_i1.p1 TRINITY_DN247_c5_g1~~TRINITY_DN247_c5_g1_i1.p1  ORF type:complete len:199 (+),score=36.55 TRINITY_DN247_c5_g1_i1:70-597(+)
MLSRFAVRAATRSQVRGAAIPASQFSGEKDPKFLQFQSTCAIENLYEFNVTNVAKYNVELRKLADLKVNDILKSTYEVMKSRHIVPDSTTVEILMRSAEPQNARRAIYLFDDILKFKLDPTAQTYRTLAAVFKAAKEDKIATLLTKMAKAEDRYGSDDMVALVAEFHKLSGNNSE